VTKARPDGYQFLHGDVGINAQNQALYKNPPYNTATDFAPVGLIYEQPMVLLARRNLPVGNLQEFVAYAKANAAKMQFASPGVGNAAHLACTQLNLAFGLNVTHVPYRGNAPAMQDMIAGRIDYLCGTVTVAIPQVLANTVKAIAVLSKNRSPALADLASTQEQGASNLDSDGWCAFFLPRGTPAAIVRRLNAATTATLDAPSVRERLKELGAIVVPPERRSPEYLQTFVENEIETWRAVVKATGLSAD
jgi:tripartite-type tricarboxylate transporter receptor subunit TctC